MLALLEAKHHLGFDGNSLGIDFNLFKVVASMERFNPSNEISP